MFTVFSPRQAIHPNGGFTKVWVSLKTIMLPLVIAALAFNIHRINQLKRSYNLLERWAESVP